MAYVRKISVVIQDSRIKGQHFNKKSTISRHHTEDFTVITLIFIQGNYILERLSNLSSLTPNKGQIQDFNLPSF